MRLAGWRSAEGRRCRCLSRLAWNQESRNAQDDEAVKKAVNQYDECLER
jgi:hypothetical protein